MEFLQWLRPRILLCFGQRGLRRGWLPLLALLLPLGLSGCLKHTRLLERPQRPTIVMTTSPQALIQSLDDRYDQIHSLKATVLIQASVGGANKGKITDYTSVRGYILLRQPNMLRVLGLVPVVETRAFDMASDGKSFKLLIPAKDMVIVGTGTVTSPSKNPLMNLRPSVFYDSLLVGKVEPDDYTYVTTDTRIVSTSSENILSMSHLPVPGSKHLIEEPDYELGILRRPDDSHVLTPERVIHISRTNLLPYQQDEYDSKGIMVTRTLYSDYQTFDGIPYPTHIVIYRPIDGYRLDLKIQQLTLNLPLKDEQFELRIPDGTKIKQLP